MPAPLRTRALTVLASAVLLVAGCSGAGSSDSSDDTPDSPDASSEANGGDSPAKLRDYYTQDLEWEDCDAGECATAKVPVDYAAPDGDTTELKLVRRPADNQNDRIGTLFLNPGGPGGSGLDYVDTFASNASDELLARYDLVGFDPRGVATSDPVDCVSDGEQDDIIAADPDPDTGAEVREMVAMARKLGEGCLAKSGELASHVSTIEVARDLDVLRALVGDDKLTYAGASYGTFIGSTYAELFSKRVGRMVLDGAIDPTLSSRESSLAQAKGFEKAFRAYAKDCVGQGGSSCPLGGDVDAGVKRLSDFLRGLDDKPLDTGDEDRPLTRSLAMYGIVLPLYDERGWPVLSQALSSAFDGDGSILLELSDQYFQRSDSGYADNQFEAQLAVNCLDTRPDTSIAEVRNGVGEFKQAAPVFGEFLAWGDLTCANWPPKSSEKPITIEGAGADPVVVVGTTRDPATPYEQAVALAKQLDSGVLLTHEGDGHTAYYRGNDCVDDTLDTYLLEGKVPENGKRC